MREYIGLIPACKAVSTCCAAAVALSADKGSEFFFLRPVIFFLRSAACVPRV